MFARIVENRFRKGRVNALIALRILLLLGLLDDQCDRRFWMFPFRRVREWGVDLQSPSSEK